MKLGNREVSAAVVFVFLSTYLTVYTAQAHTIAVRHIYEGLDGKASWRTTPAGSLFPLPREPGMLQALSSMNEVDSFIYRYLIKPWTLIRLLVLLWATTGLSIFIVAAEKMGVA